MHIRGSRRFKHHQNSTGRPPREGRKKEKCEGRGKKKRENLGRSGEGGPPEGGPGEGGLGEGPGEGSGRRKQKKRRKKKEKNTRGTRRRERRCARKTKRINKQQNKNTLETSEIGSKHQFWTTWPQMVDLAKVGLAKLGVVQTWPKLVLAKLGFGQRLFGQTWIWPMMVWPNLVLGKVGLAKVGHSRAEYLLHLFKASAHPLLHKPMLLGGPRETWPHPPRDCPRWTFSAPPSSTCVVLGDPPRGSVLSGRIKTLLGFLQSCCLPHTTSCTVSSSCCRALSKPTRGLQAGTDDNEGTRTNSECDTSLPCD